MKFKPLYFYGAIGVVLIVTLFIVSQSSKMENTKPIDITSEQKIPDDEIHNPLKSDDAPNKDNVSEGFRHKLEMLEKSIKENPKDTLKIREYADLLAAAHKKDKAIEYYQKLLDINPKRTDILFSLSFIYYSSGDLDKAEVETKKILSFEPGNVNAHYNLGAIAAGKGDKERAREIWTNLAEKYPDDEIGIRAKNSIEKL
jgi:tetratricopeptide (TPR) repeat protein